MGLASSVVGSHGCSDCSSAGCDCGDDCGGWTFRIFCLFKLLARTFCSSFFTIGLRAAVLLPFITMLDKICGLLSLLLVLAAVLMVVVSKPETGSSESSKVGVVVVTVESA